MSVPTVQLSGSALVGVDPQLHVTTGLAELPQTVCLGRRRPAARPNAPRLTAYFDRERLQQQLPTSLNRRAKAAASIARLYLNDRYGDCVIAGKGHALGVWSGNDTDAGGLILATDKEILDQYHAICGAGDQGCIITEVLDVMRSTGFLAGGKRYKIDGYVAVDWTQKDLVQVVQYLFGASTIGINLPKAWTSGAVWDITSTPIIGGHDVTPIDYDSEGVYVASWGRIYLITWRAFTSTKWLEEMYALLAPSWYNADKIAPCGIDAATLLADLNKLAHGELPPLPDPVPPPVPPPGPPTPPSPAAYPNYAGTAIGTVHLAGGVQAPVSLSVHLAPAAPKVNGSIPWLQILGILETIVPVIITDVQAGKPVWQIISDVMAALVSSGHTAERYGVSSAEWQQDVAKLTAAIAVNPG